MKKPRSGKPNMTKSISVSTVGYEGAKSVEEFISKLKERNITYLVDVRANAWSRKQGFSRQPLSSVCTSKGIGYTHLSHFGIPSADRKDSTDRKQLLDTYRRRLVDMDDEKDDLYALCRNETVALMCFESDPEQCHRSVLAEALREMECF